MKIHKGVKNICNTKKLCRKHRKVLSLRIYVYLLLRQSYLWNVPKSHFHPMRLLRTLCVWVSSTLQSCQSRVCRMGTDILADWGPTFYRGPGICKTVSKIGQGPKVMFWQEVRNFWQRHCTKSLRNSSNDFTRDKSVHPPLFWKIRIGCWHFFWWMLVKI